MFNKEILRIALPSIITNITVPLLGIVDVAITGHIGNSTVAIGAIAVGGLVFWYGMGVEGVALGTVMAQYVGLLAAWKLSTYLSTKIVDNSIPEGYKQEIVDNLGEKPESYQQSHVDNSKKLEWKTFFTVNRHIFRRMICLIAVTTAFTSYGSHLGDTLLAVNTLLMQLFILFSYFSDGFALAGEAIVGKYYGGEGKDTTDETRDAIEMRGSMVPQVVRRLFLWGAGVMD